MFCTSIRRRASVSAIVPTLTSPPPSLRESQLNTHDLAIPLNDPRRQLRVLVLSPTSTGREARIEHFAALTGGTDLAIIFLCTPSSAESMHVFAALQAEPLMSTGPQIPVLPVASIEALATTLQRHIAHLTRPRPDARTKSIRVQPFELLKMCTANPPMREQTAFLLTDLFGDVKDLAQACVSEQVTPDSSMQAPSSDVSGVQGVLEQLRDVLGEAECRDVVEFWREEWIVE